MKRVLVIDNYDSFTYNLVHYIEKLTGVKPSVFRNDEINLDAISNYEKILISPGPGIPGEAGICLDLIKKYSTEKSILGICLGVQAIGEAFGAGLVNLSEVYHGVASKINVIDRDEKLLKDLPESFIAGRYHSWVVSSDNIPDCLKVTCVDDNGMIMGISHKEYDVRGLQFHPESVLTEYGYNIIRNWMEL
jgi:anthranilate synthase component II